MFFSANENKCLGHIRTFSDHDLDVNFKTVNIIPKFTKEIGCWVLLKLEMKFQSRE